jgi:hypothetical protein
MAIVSEAVAYLQRADGQLDKAVAQARIFEVELERLILQHGDFGTHTQPAVFSR